MNTRLDLFHAAKDFTAQANLVPTDLNALIGAAQNLEKSARAFAKDKHATHGKGTEGASSKKKAVPRGDQIRRGHAKQKARRPKRHHKGRRA